MYKCIESYLYNKPDHELLDLPGYIYIYIYIYVYIYIIYGKCMYTPFGCHENESSDIIVCHNRLELTQMYRSRLIVKLNPSDGPGTWNPFTVISTFHKRISTLCLTITTVVPQIYPILSQMYRGMTSMCWVRMAGIEVSCIILRLVGTLVWYQANWQKPQWKTTAG